MIKGLTLRTAAAVLTLGFGFAGITAASAQVYYARPHAPAVDFFSPYDESYGTSPAFEILPTPYGYAPGVRVVERCQYPNGWNVTDFGRDVNGIPAGLDHTCPVGGYGNRVRTRY